MFRLIAVALALVCLYGGAQAQFNSFPPGAFTGKAARDAGTASYQGPGDVYSTGIYAWWAIDSCWNNAYAGKVVDITDAATGNTTGSRVMCASGITSALVSGSACTFVTGNACSSIATTCAVSCNVLTAYDQSGQTNCGAAACDVTRATNSQRPIYTANYSGGKACATFNAANSQELLTAATTTAENQPFFTSSVLNTGTPGASGNAFIGIGGGDAIYLNSPAATFVPDAGVVAATFAGSASTTYALQFLWNAASSTYSLNGSGPTTVSTSIGTNGLGANDKLDFGGDTFNGDSYTGVICEQGLWISSPNSTQQGNLTSNERSRYAF